MKYVYALLMAGFCSLWGADSIVDRMPVETLFYVYCDVNGYIDGLDEYNQIREIFEEGGAMHEFLQPAFEAIEDKFTEIETEQELDFKILDSLGFLKSEYGLCIVGADYAGVDAIPGFMLVMDAGDNEESIAHILELIVERVGDTEEQIALSKQTIADADFHVLNFVIPEMDDIELPDGMEEEVKDQIISRHKNELEKKSRQMEDNPIMVGVADGYLIASNRENLIDSFCADEAGGLGSEGEYQAVMQKTGGEVSPLNVYVNVEQIFNLIGDIPQEEHGVDPEEFTERLEKIHIYGFSELQQVGVSVAFSKGRMEQKMFLAMPEGDEGILKAVIGGANAPVIPRTLNSETAIAAGCKLDIEKAYNQIILMITAFEPGFPDEFEQSQAGMKEQIGMTVLDIAKALNGNIVFSIYPNPDYIVPEEGEVVPGAGAMSNHIVLQIGVDNSELLNGLIRNVIIPQTGPLFQTEDFMGETLYATGAFPESPVKPGFCITDSALLFSTSADEVRAIIRRKVSDDFVPAPIVADGIVRLDGMEPVGAFSGLVLYQEKNNVLVKAWEDQIRMGVREFNANNILELELDESALPRYNALLKYFKVHSWIRGGMTEDGFLLKTVTLKIEDDEEETEE